MTRSANKLQWVAAAVGVAAIWTVGLVMSNEPAGTQANAIANAQTQGPRLFESLGAPPGAKPLSEMTTRAVTLHHGTRLYFERQYEVDGKFDDAIAFYRTKGWTLVDADPPVVRFRRGNWDFELQRDTYTQDDYRITTRLVWQR